MVELVDRATIELARSDEFVAGFEQRLQGQELRGVSGRHSQRRCSALESGKSRLKNRLSGVVDARVDIAERLQSKQCRGVVGIIEDERRRLIDWRRACPGRRIGSGSSVYGLRRKLRRRLLRHESLLSGDFAAKEPRPGQSVNRPCRA